MTIKQGFTFEEAHALYMTIAPEAFERLAAPFVPMLPRDDGFFLEAGQFPFFGHAAIASTAFCTRDNTFVGHATEINFNPAYLDGIYEDELKIVLWHEIAHAASPWEFAHDRRWSSRAAMFHPAAGLEFFDPRMPDPYPGQGWNGVGGTPTLGWL